MPGSSNNSSFIPKRGASKRKRKVRKGNIYVLTIVASIILTATLLASAGIYLYQQYINNQLQNEITQMNAAVSGFKEADMQRVQEFDVRLRQANQRLNNNASVAAILDSIEASVIDTVRLSGLSVTRNLDDNFIVNADIQTDTFDSTIFQRGIFVRGDVIDIVEVSDVNLTEVSSAEPGTDLQQSVTFSAKLSVPISAVLYQPSAQTETFVPTPPVLPVTSEGEVDDVDATDDSDSEVNNQDDI